MNPRLIWLSCLVLYAAAPGLDESPAASDALAVSPVNVDFGKQVVNSQSSAANITIRNPSSSAVRFNQIISSGIDFESNNNCGTELATGAECAIQVVFKPAISGDRMGAIEIAASDSGSPHYVSLTGIGE